MASEILATNVVIKIDNKVFGCAQTATFTTEVAMVDVTCAATGNFKSQVPGQESWSGSFSAIVRTFPASELTTNVTLREVYTKLRERTKVEVEYDLGHPDNPADTYTFTAQAYLTNVAISIPEGSGLVTWTANVVGYTPMELV
jgi:hypothetical protein